MDVISPGGRDFSSQVEVIRMKQHKQLNNLLNGQSVIFRVIDAKNPFSALRASFIGPVYFSFFATATSLA